jgi:hypothetical protein
MSFSVPRNVDRISSSERLTLAIRADCVLPFASGARFWVAGVNPAPGTKRFPAFASLSRRSVAGHTPAR